MDAIYRCTTTGGKVIEIDADTFDSVGIIKGLAKIVHGVDVVDILDEIQVSTKREKIPMTRLPDGLRSFIEKRMSGARNLVCHFSWYVLKHKIKESKYGYVFDAMVEREKEETEQRHEERKTALASREARNESVRQDRAARKIGEIRARPPSGFRERDRC